MYSDQKIYIAKDGDEKLYLLPDKANRHGLIAGATGTGKTVTLKVLAESFSDAGVPVFLADVKGDLAGMCRPGIDTEDMQNRVAKFALAEDGFTYQGYPTAYWDIYGKMGMPLRTTVTEMGPTLFAKLLDLTPTQEDVLNIVFRIADEEKLLLIDIKDLRSMVIYVSENAAEYSSRYGNISKASINVILRGVTALESDGGSIFFGEPALDIRDWIRTSNGKGVINVLDSQSLINSPAMYSTFLLWMLSELFEVLPEVGDLEKPRLVFFFDEAHLLFTDAPKPLLQKIEQVVKLIRSKGVGVYFVTQNPKDIPNGVLAQLGNKIQHALHAYTPDEMKALKAAADSFRTNPDFKTVDVLQELGTGEALVSFLQEDGTPSVVKRAKILPPQSQMGALDDSIRSQQINANDLFLKYNETIDRDSAYEFLNRWNIEQDELKAKAAAEEAARKAAEKEAAEAEKAAEKARIAEEKAAAKAAEKAKKEEEKAAEKARKEEEKAEQKKKNARKTALKNVGKSAAGTVGREVGKLVGNSVGGSFGKTLGGNIGASIGRGLLGTLFGGK